MSLMESVLERRSKCLLGLNRMVGQCLAFVSLLLLLRRSILRGRLLKGQPAIRSLGDVTMVRNPNPEMINVRSELALRCFYILSTEITVYSQVQVEKQLRMCLQRCLLSPLRGFSQIHHTSCKFLRSLDLKKEVLPPWPLKQVPASALYWEQLLGFKLDEIVYNSRLLFCALLNSESDQPVVEVVTSLQVQEARGRVVRVTWVGVQGATSYRVSWRKTDGDGSVYSFLRFIKNLFFIFKGPSHLFCTSL